ncbi:MAG: hypothetical protein ACR2JW_07625 [Thermomicrobiales bacterium]
MYTEQLRMSTRLTALLALPFAIPVVLLGVIALVPMLAAGKIAVVVGALLEAVLGACLLTTLSRIRILFTKRIALRRIVTCAPTDARVWDMSYTYRGTMHRTTSGAKRAVRLTLTNGAEVLFTTRHADAVCEALHSRRSGM